MPLLEATLEIQMTSLLRGERVSRLGDKSLGRLNLDPQTRRVLASNRVGILAEGFLRLDTMVGRLASMAKRRDGARTMVLYPSKGLAEDIRACFDDCGLELTEELVPDVWVDGSLILGAIESLPRIPAEVASSIDTLILVDPTCMVYRARAYRLRNGRNHDRPQIIADFLSDQITRGMDTTFMLMTRKRAGALPTDQIARAYGLEAWWFLDGPSIRT